MDFTGIKADFECIWNSFVEAIVRFWNNRFVRGNEEIVYLREEISRLQQENKGLIERLISPNINEVNIREEEKEFQPVTTNRFIPWRERRAMLERKSREAAISLAREAEVEVERGKSTEQLEKELGIS